MKALSVIVPSYDMEKSLPDCLGSLVVSPDLMDKLEVLVVNDGSTDRTGEIAHGFALRYPRTFRVIDKANGHYGSCVNRGLGEATGAFVKILDADDRFYTDSLASFLAALDGICASDRARPDLILSDYDVTDVRRRVLSHRTCRYESAVDLPVSDALSSLILVPMHAVAYRTGLLREIGYRQTEGILYTDNEWTTYPIPYARTFRYLPLNLYAYTVGRDGQSVATDVVLKNGTMLVEVAARLCEAAGDGRIPEACRTFYRAVLERFAPSPYVACLREARLSEVNERLSALDSFTAGRSGALYDLVDEISFPRRKGFRYVHAWRKNRRLGLPTILLLRFIFTLSPKLCALLEPLRKKEACR